MLPSDRPHRTSGHSRALVELLRAPAIRDGVLVVDRHGQITFANDAAERLVDGTDSAIVGTPIDRLVPPRFAATHPLTRAALSAPSAPTDATAAWLQIAEGRERCLEIATAPLGEPDGSVLVTLRDVTELETLRRAALALDRSVLTANLAAALMHDLNNYALAVASALAFLEDDSLTPEERRDVVGEAGTAVSALRELLGQALWTARAHLGSVTPERVNVSQKLRLLEPVVRRVLPKGVGVTVVADDALHALLVPGSVMQAVLNLALNSARVLREGDRFAVYVTGRTLTAPTSMASGTMSAGRYVEVTVADNGPGMSPEVRERLFTPGFTRFGDEGGLGLGLWSIAHLTRGAGGGVDLQTAPGEGARFTLYFPQAPDSVDAVPR